MNSPVARRLGIILVSMGLVLASGSVHADAEQDPWEGFNRKVYAFNNFADKYFLKPVTQAYRFVAPEFVEKGVSNVFANVLEVPSALNGLLQGKPGAAGKDTGRFLINSTLGVAGWWDVASHMGLENGDKEDFGQTLSVWGFDQGPYLVLPFLGASTLRDTLALPVEWITDPLYQIDHTRTRNTTLSFYYLDRRSQLMELEEHLVGDRYVFIRDAYLQRREYLVNDGEVEDEFGSGAEYDEY